MSNPHSTHYDRCHQPLKYAIQIRNEKYLVLKCFFTFLRLCRDSLSILKVQFTSLRFIHVSTLGFTNTHLCSAHWKHGVYIEFKCCGLNPVLQAVHTIKYARLLSQMLKNRSSEMPCGVFAVLNISTHIWIKYYHVILYVVCTFSVCILDKSAMIFLHPPFDLIGKRKVYSCTNLNWMQNSCV